MTGTRAIRAAVTVVSVLVLAACSGSSSTQAPVVTPTFGPPDIRGIAYHGTWTSRDDLQRAEILDAIAQAGIPWVRLDVAWTSLQPTSPEGYDDQAVAALDQQLTEISQRGLKALVMFWWAPQWSSGTGDQGGVPRDVEDYAQAASWLVDRWPSQIQALEVWNEPNLPEFYAQNTDAASYARLLKAAYPAVKAVRPDLTVVSAAPASMDLQWYADFYDQDVVGSFDALGAHPYPVIGDAPPKRCQQQPDSGCNMEQLTDFMASRGDATTPIWVTEFGWSSHPDPPELQPWQRGVTEKQQAKYTASMLAYFSRVPQVRATFLYRDRDFTDNDAHQNGFGILRADNTRKPVYYVVTCSSASRCMDLARAL